LAYRATGAALNQQQTGTETDRGGRRAKMATLRATGCNVGAQSITIFFSEKVDASALNTANYSLFAPDAGFVNTAFTGTVKPVPDNRSVVLEFGSAVFGAGQWVQVTVTGVAAVDTAISSIISNHVSGRTPSDSARTVKDVEDAISYPVLTEEIGYRPSPVGSPTGGVGGGSIPSGGGANLGQVALRAVGDVLGWKPNVDDPKGFIGALTQSFTLTDVEGHVESKWMPRTYAVQTDLGGGVTGAQASLYMRAKDALDQSLSLLDGLYPLDPEADPEYVKALREMARSQMTEIVKELGTVGLPSILRIDTYFDILLGQHPTRNFTHVQFDPDKIKGTLGELRDTYGIKFRGNQFNNSVEDEQDITNFRVISDYMTSLMQSWIANREFFVVKPRQLAFFGTQLVLISRQLNVIAETVNEVRFTLDSVFIGPNERQTLLLEFRDESLPAMFLEDMLVEIENFVTNEGPQLLRDGGKISVTNNILPVVRSLRDLVIQAHDPKNRDKVPDGFRTARVRRSLDDLRDQLRELIRLTEQVEQQVPPAEDELSVSGVQGSVSSTYGYAPYTVDLSFFGSGFDTRPEVSIHSPVQTVGQTVVFYSAQRIDVTFDPDQIPPGLENGDHEVKVTNPDGESATLRFTYSWDAATATVTVAPINGGDGNGGYGGGLAPRAAAKPRPLAIKTPDGTESSASAQAPGATPVRAPSADTTRTPAPATAAAAIPAPASAAATAAPTQQVVTPEHVAAVQNQIDEMKKTHETWFQRLEDKISDLVENKSKGKKGGGDGD
jgi:hypothetical protein